MPRELNKLERDVLDYLVDYVRTNTYQPSIREIGAEFAIKSTKTVSEVLQSLADKGWIERSSARSRGVRLLGLELDADVVSVPHIDVHLDGGLSLDDPVDNLTLDRRIAGSAGCFLVTMVGNAMQDDGIRDGDLVLIEPVPDADLIDGDLALCRVGPDTSVRRVREADGQMILEAGRRLDDAVVILGGEATEVLGRVAAVVRRLRTDRPLGKVAPEPVDESVVAG